MSPYFIDFEGFQYRGQYIIKELCIMDVDKPLQPLYYMFTPITNWSRLSVDERLQFGYQKKYIHHIDWYAGHVLYSQKAIMQQIKQDFQLWDVGIFYVMDRFNGDKLKFLKQEFPQLRMSNYNITFHSLPRISSNIQCIYCNHGAHCAYLKCMRLCYHYIPA